MARQRRSLMCGLYATLVTGMLFASPAGAAVINYNEATDGDLPTLTQDSPVFDLDIGTNTFTGEITFSNATNVSTNFDSFAFNIPTGNRLESILLDVSLLSIGSGIFSEVGYELENSSFNSLASESIAIPSTNLSLFVSNLPLGSGQFALQNRSLFGSLSSEEFRTAAYTFSLNVTQAAPVPEPNAALIMLLLGTFGTGLMLKRKRKIV